MTPLRLIGLWAVVVIVGGWWLSHRRRDPHDIEGRLQRFRENDGR